MPLHSDNLLRIEQASPAELAPALDLVFGRLAAAARTSQVGEALTEIERSGGDRQIVLLARRAGQLVGAIWAQIQPGQVASLWPPGLIAGEPAATAAALVDLAVAKSAAVGAKLVQSLLEPREKSQFNCLRQCGFQHATDLLYLVCPRAKFPVSKPHSELLFEPLKCDSAAANLGKSSVEMVNVADWARLANIVQQTYQGTQDCPAVQGVRSVDEVLTSYLGVGQFDPDRWFIVRHVASGNDLGCLLLTEYQQQQNWELVYMGLIPEARGHGWGLQMVLHSQWLAAQVNCVDEAASLGRPTTTAPAIERLVLAVDAANSPAVAMYSAAGFEVWDRRTVFLRQIG